jgi:hypothetical protein
MDKKQLLNVVDSILLPLGYKRKNSRWQLVDAVVTKGVDLQRSRFENRQLGVVSDYVIAVANLQIGEFNHHTSKGICAFLPLYSAAALLYV